MPKQTEFKAKIEIGFQNKKKAESNGMFNMKLIAFVLRMPFFWGW